MPGWFELKNAVGDQKFMFNLKAGNGEIILTSETYKGKGGAETGIASVKTNAPTDARYDRKISTNHENYFVLKAANGEPIGISELYSSSGAMETGIAAVKSDAPTGPIKDRT